MTKRTWRCYVSLEVSPQLAHDTVAALLKRGGCGSVQRPNLMIKIPATPQGIPAIEQLISEGINVNVTLMFSMKHYEVVARAYIAGLERRAASPDVTKPLPVSVASFFVSRVDTAVDALLEKIGTPEALNLRGKIAIANAKLAYQRFREVFYGEPFASSRKALACSGRCGA